MSLLHGQDEAERTRLPTHPAVSQGTECLRHRSQLMLLLAGYLIDNSRILFNTKLSFGIFISAVIGNINDTCLWYYYLLIYIYCN